MVASADNDFTESSLLVVAVVDVDEDDVVLAIGESSDFRSLFGDASVVVVVVVVVVIVVAFVV